jgi:glycine/D-amino acid oxidase-like deaminating enzyme
MSEPSDHTFYAATAKPAPERPPLTQELEVEVCVIGGGFAGLWAARALALRGKEVVVLEGGEIAGGASGQNGGFVSAGYAAGIEKIAARVGLDHARALYDLSREGVEIVRAAISSDRRAVQAKPGRLHVLRQNDEAGLSDHAEMLSRDFGHELELWRKERVRSVLLSDRYYQALHEPDAFHLHPLNLARILAAEIEDHGGRIFEHSRVVSADIEGLRKSLITERGRIRAFDVVIAGSASVGAGFPWLAETILPIRTHVVVTAPLGERVKQAIRYEGAIADTRRAGDYYHLAGDRLLWGGRISARKAPPRALERLMAKDIARVYPQLKDAPIDYAWSGVMGYAVHMMPQVGMARPGAWVSSAFGGHGLNTTAIAGELIASAIAEQDDRWRLFIPFGLVWNGGRAGRAIAQSVYWGMQCKDWLDEAQSRAIERDEAAASAGLAPGFAAHAARRAKRRFLESALGRASLRVARAAIIAAQPFIWAGRQIYRAVAAVGRALVPVIWLIARGIGAGARAVGKAMDMIAAAIVALSRAAATGAVHGWRHLIVPAAGWAGRKGEAGGRRALARGRDAATALRRWSVERARSLQQQLIDARNRGAEESAAAVDAETKEAESAAVTDPAEASAEGKPRKKKKQSKEKQDSVEA